jgi:hypothetical protein
MGRLNKVQKILISGGCLFLLVQGVSFSQTYTSFKNYLQRLESHLSHPNVKGNLYYLFLELRKQLLQKEKKEALKTVEEILKIVPLDRKVLILSSATEKLNNVKNLNELTKQLSLAIIYLQNYELPAARDILNNLKSEVVIKRQILPKNILLSSLALIKAVLEVSPPSYSAAISAVDNLIASVREETIIIPLPVLKAYYQLERLSKNTNIEDFKKVLNSVWLNLKIAHYLGYINLVTYKDLENLYNLALQKLNQSEKPSSEVEKMKTLLQEGLGKILNTNGG